MNCVRCSTEMTAMQIEGEQVLGCPSGHGLWMAPEQLAHMASAHDDDHTPAEERSALRAGDAAPDAMVTEKFRSCPVCATTMRKDDYRYGSGVVIDVCDEHGVWLDRGEINRIDAWAEGMSAHWQKA